MEIIHEDFLERCIPNGSKKEYKKNYFVFRRDDSGCKTLEFFKDSSWRKNEPRGVCNLFNGYSVRPMGLHETKKKFGLMLITVGKSFELHASSEKLRERWIEVLNKDLETLHNAKLLESPLNAHSFFRHSKGDYHLQITDCSVILLSNRVTHITWRFGTIRRYKSKDGAFVLEVGRKAPTGEGIFRFQVANPNTLFDELDKALKQRIAQKRNQDSSLEPNRTSSFDGSNNCRSINIRGISMDERPLPPDPPAYNTLDNIPTHTTTQNASEQAGYDKLFGTTPPNQPTSSVHPILAPQLFQNKSIIGQKGNVDEGVPDENYIDMSGMKEELICESQNVTTLPETRPRPVPRPPSNASVILHSGVNRPDSRADDDLIDLNTYDCPSPLDTTDRDESINEYHHLNNHTPPTAFSLSVGYDHLNQIKETPTTPPHVLLRSMTENVYGNSVVEMYDSPKSQSTNHNSESVDNNNSALKPLPPPIPSRPCPPVRRPRPASDKSSDTVLVLGKSPVSSDTIYDSPRSNSQDKSFPLSKATSLDTNDVYQVPRTDSLVLTK